MYNAIFSRCPLRNATIIRNPPSTDYFSSVRSFSNAYGYEKRLGQRAILFATTVHSAVSEEWYRAPDPRQRLLIGSIHKLSGSMFPTVRQYIQTAMQTSLVGGIVIAGDQNGGICQQVGLAKVSTNGTSTWPASCSSFGRSEGDIMCFNSGTMSVEQAQVLLPCSRDVALSDHAILAADFLLL